MNRKLKESDLVVKRSRGQRARSELGEYFLLNTRINGISWNNLDIEAYAREIGSLQPFEYLIEEK